MNNHVEFILGAGCLCPDVKLIRYLTSFYVFIRMESIFIGDVYRQRAFNAFNYTQDFIVPRMDLPRMDFFFFTEATILSLSFVFTRVLILPSFPNPLPLINLAFLSKRNVGFNAPDFSFKREKKKKNDTVSLLLFLFFKHILRLYTLIHTSGVSSRVSLYSIC